MSEKMFTEIRVYLNSEGNLVEFLNQGEVVAAQTTPSYTEGDMFVVQGFRAVASFQDDKVRTATEIKNSVVMMNCLLETIQSIIEEDNFQPDDFMMSFGPVRQVYELKHPRG